MILVRRSRNYPHGLKVDECAHLACTRPRANMQLCHAHLQRLYRGQSIATPIGRDAAPYACEKPGCPKPEFLDGLCHRHWRRHVVETLAEHPIYQTAEVSA